MKTSISRLGIGKMAAFSIMGFLILSCGHVPADRVEITFWAMGTEGKHIEKLLPEFERAHPGIKVKVQTIPWSLAHEKLLTAFAGDSNPDVCQLGNTWIPEFQAIGAVLSLDSLIAQSTIINEEAFFDGIWQTNVVGGKVWGIPWYVDTRLLFYRTDLLKKAGYGRPPDTWEEWLEAARAIQKLNVGQARKYAVFLPLLFNDFHVPVILIMNNGGRFLKDGNRHAAFDDRATMEALRFYLTFFEEGLASRSMTEFTNIYQAFAAGDIAMMVTGPWNVGELRTRKPQLDGKWSTAVMPKKRNRHSSAGGASLVVFENCKYPEAAFKLVEFLCLSETQAKFFHLTRDLPSVHAAWQAPELQRDREVQAFYEQLQHVHPTPKIAEWEQIAVKLQEHLLRVIFGEVTLERAVQDLNRDVNRILEKRRWLLSKELLLSEKSE